MHECFGVDAVEVGGVVRRIHRDWGHDTMALAPGVAGAAAAIALVTKVLSKSDNAVPKVRISLAGGAQPIACPVS